MSSVEDWESEGGNGHHHPFGIPSASLDIVSGALSDFLDHIPEGVYRIARYATRDENVLTISNGTERYEIRTART